MDEYSACNLCPRKCGINRHEKLGFCKSPAFPVVNISMIHHGEEPPISGDASGIRGSGTVFFEGCSLRCPFCQNYCISNGTTSKGTIKSAEELSDLYLKLQDNGAYNINLVTPLHYSPEVSKSIEISKNQGLSIPVAINTGGYESVDTLKMFDGLVDIYMPDFKFWDSSLSRSIIGVSDYKDQAIKAINEMYRQTGPFVLDDKSGLMKSGMIVRHLMMPGKLFDTKKILDYLCKTYGNNIYISLMSQYTPMPQLTELKLKNPNLPDLLMRKVPAGHYESATDYLIDLGQTNAFTQDDSSATGEMIPPFKF